MTIVLIIIGLIVGGVLVGQDLIHSAQIRRQISQIEKYNTAVHTFQLKYNGLPGDLLYTQAPAFGLFGITSTYNYNGGDDNGLIQSNGCGSNVPVCTADDLTGEPLIFWRQLSDAKLIDGAYGTSIQAAGTIAPGSVNTIGDVNQYLPPAKLGSGASIEANSAGDGNNYFMLMSVTSFWGYGGHNAGTNPLTAQEAYAIDTKMDDGLPATGNVIAINSINGLDNYSTWTTVSAVSGCVASSAYARTETTLSCSLRFKFQ